MVKLNTFAGYDIMMGFGLSLKKFGIHFDQCVNNTSFAPLQTEFHLESDGKNGFENNAIPIGLLI